jgi:hypothetical protein
MTPAIAGVMGTMGSSQPFFGGGGGGAGRGTTITRGE